MGASIPFFSYVKKETSRISSLNLNGNVDSHYKISNNWKYKTSIHPKTITAITSV